MSNLPTEPMYGDRMPAPVPTRPRLRVAMWVSGALVAMVVAQLVLGKVVSLHAMVMLGTLAGNVGIGLLAKSIDRVDVPFHRPTVTLATLGVVAGLVLGVAGAGMTGLMSELVTALVEGTEAQSIWETLLADRETVFNDILLLDRPLLIPVVFLVIAVTPGIAEEFFFRGVMQSLLASLPAIRRCLFIGIVFGLIHFDPVGTLPLIVLGTLFALVREWTGSWIVPAIMHISFNALNALVLVRLDGFDANSGVFFVVGTLVSIPVMVWLRRESVRALPA